jgi:hypothetical protein
MLDLPDTIWIARREYERFDGIEQIEAVVTMEELLPGYVEYEYEITKYVRADENPS